MTSTPWPAPAARRPVGRDQGGAPLAAAADRLRTGSLATAGRRFWSGWAGSLLVTVLAFVIRVKDLGNPPGITFDETYYAKDGYSLWHTGYEQNWSSGADAGILAGTDPTRYMSGGEYVVHPPLGKWIIGLGEQIFGMNAFGWRITTCLIGTLTVLVLARMARRVTRSEILGVLAGLLLCFDGLSVVMSRFALLDTHLAFWVLCAVAALVCDRDWSRERLARALDPRTGRLPAGLGPSMWLRPWRITAGVCFGLACATKWNGLFALAAFMVLSVAWDFGARRTAGLGGARLWWSWLRNDAIPAFVSSVPVTLVLYVLSWLGWILRPGGYQRDYAQVYPAEGVAGLVPDWLRSLWHYHVVMYDFHVGLTAHHPYQSSPWSWLIVGRPVAIATQFPAPGDCGADQCDRIVTALGTPTLWWGAVLAVIVCLALWIGKRDWRFGIPIVGLVATWLPWFQYPDRPVFYFYAVAIIPFLVLAVVLVAGLLIGPATASADRRAAGIAVVTMFTVVVVITFAYFYPIYTYQLISNREWGLRLWLGTWN